MAAGLGFKTFTTGDVLTAGDVNGYLMQGILVFASATARDTAITSPQEGQFAYLKDTNVTTYYTGSAWANVDTTGMVNPMTATGDTIYSSSGSTPAALPIGTTGQVLTVAGGLPSWSTPTGGGSNWSLFSSAALTGAQTITISGISGKDKIMILVSDASSASASSGIAVRLNTSTSSIYYGYGISTQGAASYSNTQFSRYDSGAYDRIRFAQMGNNVDDTVSGYVLLNGCNSSGVKVFNSAGGVSTNGVNQYAYTTGGYFNSSATISSISMYSGTGNFDGGTVYVYTSA